MAFYLKLKRLKVDNGNKQVDILETSTTQSVPEELTTCSHYDQKTSDSCPDQPISDTVGAICVDRYGHMSSAVSSGGILLKHSGRIGPVRLAYNMYNF